MTRDVCWAVLTWLFEMGAWLERGVPLTRRFRTTTFNLEHQGPAICTANRLESSQTRVPRRGLAHHDFETNAPNKLNEPVTDRLAWIVVHRRNKTGNQEPRNCGLHESRRGINRNESTIFRDKDRRAIIYSVRMAICLIAGGHQSLVLSFG